MRASRLRSHQLVLHVWHLNDALARALALLGFGRVGALGAEEASLARRHVHVVLPKRALALLHFVLAQAGGLPSRRLLSVGAQIERLEVGTVGNVLGGLCIVATVCTVDLTREAVIVL